MYNIFMLRYRFSNERGEGAESPSSLILSGFYLGFFVLGGSLPVVLKKIFEPRGGEKKFV